MANHVCPWWLGYLLACPLRRFLQDPGKILAPYVHEGMTVLEPGPGMGFFTLELARRVGPSGHVIAVDVQPKMLAGLNRRLARAALLERVDARLARPDSLGIDDLAGKVDFILAAAVVHELPAAAPFFAEAAKAAKPGATMLFVEPAGHVKEAQLQEELSAAAEAGFVVANHPAAIVRRSYAAVLRRA